VLGHVGLTPDAPQATVKAFDEKYERSTSSAATTTA
jgi:hypothetical protein